MSLPSSPRLFLAALSLAIATAPAQEQTPRLVRDTNLSPAPYGNSLGFVSPLGKGVVFGMETLALGHELWISNGTPAGTRLLKEFTRGPAGTYIHDPMPFGEGTGAKVGFLTFTGDQIQKTIRVTDGTPDGTIAVYDVPIDNPARSVGLLGGTANGFFFEEMASSQEDMLQLFFSDGTAAGTRLLTPAGEADPARFFSPTFRFTSGPWAYFTANTDEIWRSDGTVAGTTKVVDGFVAGDPNFFPHAAANGRIFVPSYSSELDTEELWAGPMEGGSLTRLGPAAGSSYPWSYLGNIFAAGDRVVFTVRDQDFYQRLWVSDGTPAGTREIVFTLEGYQMNDLHFSQWQGGLYVTADLWHEETESFASALVRVNPVAGEIEWTSLFLHEIGFFDEDAAWQQAEDALYFWVADENGDWDTWQTKGKAESTRLAKKIPANHPLNHPGPHTSAVTTAGVYYIAPAGSGTSGQALWRKRTANGIAKANSIRLTRPEKCTDSGFGTFSPDILPYEARPYEMTGGNLLAFVSTGDHHELWTMKPDGTRAKSIWRSPQPLGQYGALGFWGTTPTGALFTYANGNEGQQVWVSDGTRRGTRKLSDHRLAGNLGYPDRFVQVGNLWFYSVAQHDATASSLWKTDGTPAGTSQVIAADGSRPAPDYRELVAFDGLLYFLASGTDGKTALWSTDGTAANTVKLKDTWHDQTGEKPFNLTVAAGKLHFAVRLLVSEVLWQSDGTALGTTSVTTSGFFGKHTMDRAMDVNGVALFRARKFEIQKDEWWCHDATGLHTLQPYNAETLPEWYTPWENLHAIAGSQLFYSGYGSNGPTLRVTDGITPTHQVNEENPTSLYDPQYIVAVGNTVYFSALDAAHGYELWRSDGTAAGTALVADIEPGTGSSSPQDLKVMGNKLYFTAHRSSTGRELFAVDLPSE